MTAARDQDWATGFALWRTAEELAAEGHWLGAVVCYGQALRHAPGEWQWQAELAKLLAAGHRWKAAVEVLDAPGADRLDYIELLAAMLLAQGGRVGEARRRLDRLWPPLMTANHLSAPGGTLSPPQDPIEERFLAALWYAGRQEDLWAYAASAAVPHYAVWRPTCALAHGWHLCRTRRADEARRLLGPERSAEISDAGDTSVRFAHRGLRWISELVCHGVRRAAEVLPTAEGAAEVPPTVESALQWTGVLDGWRALVVFGAARDRVPRLATDALSVLALRGSPPWRDLLRQLGPDNSPRRLCTARDEPLALVDGGAEDAQRVAAARAQTVVRLLTERRSDYTSANARRTMNWRCVPSLSA